MITNLYEKLTHAEIDPEVGTALCKITGDASISLYAASVEPGKSVTPHYHSEGIELYQVISGTGTMRLGTFTDSQEIHWNSQISVTAGDCFTVEPMIVHQLCCGDNKPIQMVFTCPESHMTSDRTICTTEEIE